MSDLKPCPCCGHRAALHERRYYYGIVFIVHCVDCYLTIEGPDKQKVIKTWQRRRTDGMIAWLDAEIRKCEQSDKDTLLGCMVALHQCKKQLLKLLDGMGG